MPRVSIIVPIYNGERYLDECLGSVLRQTFTDWELLLVDDGSRDQSTTIAERCTAEDPHKIRCLAHPEPTNHGQLASRVLGASHAQADLIALMDQDDYWEPHYLEGHLRRWDEVASEGVCLSYGPGLYWYPEDAAGAKDYVQPMPEGAPKVYAPGELLPSFLGTNYTITPCPSCALLRREVLAPVRQFERLAHGSACEDQYLWWYVAARWPVAVHTHPWARYRQHDQSALVQFTASMEQFMQAELTFLRAMQADLTQHCPHNPVLAPQHLPARIAHLMNAVGGAPAPTAEANVPLLKRLFRRWLHRA